MVSCLVPSKRGTPEMPKRIKARQKDMFQRITSETNQHQALRKCLESDEKYSLEAILFVMNETRNMMDLRQELISGSYKFSGYMRFKVYEPKERIVDAPHFRDKIVQIALNNVLKEFFNEIFIYDSYACIDNKGTHKAVDRINYFIRKAKWEYGEEAQINKFDIEKFFYTIDRKILKQILIKRVMCKRTKDLLFKIIDSADSISELGLPLGNTLSQICANIYMNELDQYCKRVLKVKYYVRYADDIIVMASDKEEAVFYNEKIISFLNERLHLKANAKKTKVFSINQGVNSVGFKIYATHRLLRNDSKKKIKRKARKMKGLIHTGKMKPEKAEQILNSWHGHARHGCSYNFIEKQLIGKHGFIYVSRKGTIKIDEKQIRKDDDDAILERGKTEPVAV